MKPPGKKLNGNSVSGDLRMLSGHLVSEMEGQPYEKGGIEKKSGQS